MKTMIRLVFWLWSAAVLPGVWASGLLIPQEAGLPPLAIKSQRVEIDIQDGVASARIVQVFKNSVNRDLEAVYVFPLPENAAIADFAMTINGKRVGGELVEKEKARHIYQDIVRRMKDPGLLEHMGGNLFRVSVYPVPRNGEQKIELVYSQTLGFDGGLFKFVYPLRTGDQASRTLEDFTVGVRLVSSLPIKTVYSPSHAVGMTRKNDREVRLGFEEERSLLDRDFVLYYGVSKKDFGLNLLTHAGPGRDGYFLMMIAPSLLPRAEDVIPKDVTFVVDTSGSMRGVKLEQARKALEYGVRTLNAGDRFNIIRFSTEAESFRDTWVAADAAHRQAAVAFIGQLQAQGGTCIQESLEMALRQKADSHRPAFIVFLTDGKPTIGETDTEKIARAVQTANPGKTRIFVFGVGEEVNAHLLDRLSGQNGGLSQYIRTDENIEEKVSALADKISQPVLAQVRVEVAAPVKILQTHPRELPDLFGGEQVVFFGRYQGRGDAAIRLKGEVNGELRELVYEGTFPAVNADNDFIPRLWATRRVGTLLDEIRLHGENNELKDEVIRLSREFGILTPYTSYLVVEGESESARSASPRPVGSPTEEKALASRRRRNPDDESTSAARQWLSGREHPEKGGAPHPAASDAVRFSLPVFDAKNESNQSLPTLEGDLGGRGSGVAKARVVTADGGDIKSAMREETGVEAIALSRAIAAYTQRVTAGPEGADVRHLEGRIFYLIRGIWVDGGYRETMREISMSFASDEYFKLLREKPELRKFLALGTQVIVCLGDDVVLRVTE